ncbi:uncharacterized protein C8orf48 homolog [Lineus longissimus]|uniref:uncharacterized protein C8orf48 homolog n=1 Tax=Lineus longissimus TaxID=88925 RepID=UPI002B4F1746
MSEPSESYNYEADTFVSTTPTDQYTYGTDTFEGSHDISDASSQQKSYSTDTFVTETVTQDSRKYSDTFESTLSDSRQSYFDSQSTVVETPRKTLTRYRYSTDSIERTSLSGSRYTSFESSSERPSYSDTFEDIKSDEETELSLTQTTSDDSETEEEARAAEAKFLEGRYEHMVYGSVQQEKLASPSPQKPKSRREKQLISYCRKKLEVIKNNERGDFKDTYQQKSVPSAHDQILVENYGVSEGTVSRLKIQNLIDRMKQVASTEVHSPKKCRDCRHQIAQCKQDEYLKHKTAIARGKMVDERYESLCAKDSLAIFGEMIGSLPKLSDDPEDVWERLMKPLHERDTNKQQNSP